jgi:hypothetical protein
MAKGPDSSGGNKESKPDAALARRLANLTPHQFKKGQSGNPKGRRKGQRDYRTLFWIALEHIANTHNMSPEQVEEALHAAGIVKAIKGDFYFYQEISNRVYGKPMERMDVTSAGKSLADLFAQLHGKRGSKTPGANKA